MKNLLQKTVVALAASTAIIFASASAANAHDVLVDQFPSEGEVFSETPAEIRLTFNNRLLDVSEGASVINVLDANGQTVVEDAPAISDMDAVQTLPELADGAYRVVWRVVSSDGHPITGTLTFAVGTNGEEALANLPGIGDGQEPAPGELADISGLPTPLIFAISIASIGALGAIIFMFVRKAKS